MRKESLRFALAVVLACAVAACGDDDHGPRPTPTVPPTSTVPPSATAAATNTVPPPTATAPAAPTGTATAIPTGTATATVTVTAIPTGTATATVTPIASPSIVDELEAAGVGRFLGIAPASMMTSPNGIWEEYFYDPAAEQAICIRGGRYQVELRRGTNDKVLLYLEGGGACWNKATCIDSPTAKLTADPFFGAGIFEFDNPDNPFRDWNIVYAPYCDGSVFSGDNIADYGGTQAYHHGMQNVSAAVTLLRDQFPDPEQIVVAGSSAGGYGTFSGYGVARVAFPDTPIVVLNDSGPGLQNPDATSDVQDRLDNWNFAQFVPESCEGCTTQTTYLTEWALERDLPLRVGYFSALQDGVISNFLELDGPGYEALLRQVTDDLRSRQSERFKRFFVQGSIHTVLELPSFFTTEIEGTSIRDWTADLLVDGPAWQDLIEAFNPFKGFSSQRYADDSLWLCRPDSEQDQCVVNSLDATAVRPDNSLDGELHAPAEDPSFDCFYIYPTVDLTGPVGNHTDFSDISLELDALLGQAARFNKICRVFAPLYRQITLGTFGDPNVAEYQAIAYGDVEEAFRHYMGQYNNGRAFVIMGHSQGTGMTTRLLQELIDGEPQLRERLIAALMIGGGVYVPNGATVGGTFENLPLCTTAEQTGCVVAYRTYAEGFPPFEGNNVVSPDGTDTACTNPAALAGGKAPLTAYLPLQVNQPLFDIGLDLGLDIDTPFAVYRQLYTGECVKDDRGRSYLEIAYAPGSGDQRLNPIPFDHGILQPGLLGTHILDYHFALGDLIELVRVKAEALAAD